jgi:hypothetical protein
MPEAYETYGARCWHVGITGHGARKKLGQHSVVHDHPSRDQQTAHTNAAPRSSREIQASVLFSGHRLTAHARPHTLHAPQSSEWLQALPCGDPHKKTCEGMLECSCTPCFFFSVPQIIAFTRQIKGSLSSPIHYFSHWALDLLVVLEAMFS